MIYQFSARSGVSMGRLRRLLGIPRSTWARWREGRIPPRQRQLLRWALVGVFAARYMGLEPEQVLDACFPWES